MAGPVPPARRDFLATFRGQDLAARAAHSRRIPPELQIEPLAQPPDTLRLN